MRKSQLIALIVCKGLKGRYYQINFLNSCAHFQVKSERQAALVEYSVGRLNRMWCFDSYYLQLEVDGKEWPTKEPSRALLCILLWSLPEFCILQHFAVVMLHIILSNALLIFITLKQFFLWRWHQNIIKLRIQQYYNF